MSSEKRRYRIQMNDPYGNYCILELWPGGTVRSPFDSVEEAVAREQDIAEVSGWDLERVE